MVILYRDPITHAASLMEKHLEYNKLQTEDPFVLEYMNWLGHHEFGQNQKPFAFSNSGENLNGDKESLDYWLKSWINYYSFVLTLDHPNTILINYDAYCKDPKTTIEVILKKVGISADLPGYNPFVNKRKTDHEYSNDIYNSALEIYRKLNSR
jgi:hypothetical protein